MNFDFAAALVVAALVTGLVWALDALVLAGRRGVISGNQEVPRPWYVEYSRSFFPVIVIVLVVRSFLVEPFRIPSASMMPTLLAGDFILVNKFSYGVRLPVANVKILGDGRPERGDVAVFRYPEDPSVAFIKRIVGLPGDRLRYQNKVLFINGTPANQTPVADGQWESEGLYTRTEDLGPVEHEILVREFGRLGGAEWTVPEGNYFVLGDNRDNSRDSRFWGYLPDENLIGRAFVIWMNLDCVTGNGNCSRIGNLIH